MAATHYPRRLRVLVAVFAAAATLAACSSSRGPWRTDDLLKDANGRYYTTCEDPTDENHEREVWLSDDQAAAHAEGQECPAGEVRTPDYWQPPDHDQKRATLVVAPPPKTAAKTPAGAGGGAGSKRPGPSTAATPTATPPVKPVAPTGQPTGGNKPKTTKTP